MRRFMFAAVLAVAGALGFTSTADAQYLYGYNPYGYNTYGYNTYVPGFGGTAVRSYSSPFGYGYGRSYAYPYAGVGTQRYYGDVFGTRAAQSYTYSPLTNFGYTRGYYYSPGTFVGPYYTGPIARQYSYYFRP